GVEHLAEELTLEPRAIVTYGEHGVLGIGAGLEAGGDLELGCGHPAERFQRAGQEVIEDLTHPEPVALAALEPLIHIDPDARPRILRAVEVGDLRDELGRAEGSAR